MSFLEQIYAPQNTTSDILSATYSIWNILNYVAQSRDKKYRYQRGHIRPIQAEALLNMVRSPTQYCEIGFNAGHSSALVLLANKQSRATVFDTMSFSYSMPAITLLNESFGRRIELYTGRSSDTLQEACRRTLTCDVVFVDGSHIQHEVSKDLAYIKCLLRPTSLIMVDDIQSGSGLAMQKAIHDQKYNLLQKVGPFRRNDARNPCMTTPQGPLCMEWGFAILQSPVSF